MPTATPLPLSTATPTQGAWFVPLDHGAQASGAGTQALLPPAGGTVGTPDGHLSLSIPSAATGGAPVQVDLVPLDPTSLAAPEPGFRLGTSAFQVTVTNAQTGQAMHDFAAPLVLTIRPTTEDLALVGGDITRLSLTYWEGDGWGAFTCTADVGAGTLTCLLPHLTLVALQAVPPASGPLDVALPNGRFYRQANGFGGAGASGYAVVDDAEATFWSEFQRLGGVERLGYPISHRFEHLGFLTQAFQKQALQWRPELGQVLAVNVFDDLNQRGVDTWLDAFRQVPPAWDTTADAGLSFAEVVDRHVAFLEAYPALKDFYLATPDWLQTYGVPLSVQDYGPFVAVRLQRASLQLWKEEVPWAAAGQVVVANGADLAKEAGLWPNGALRPKVSP